MHPSITVISCLVGALALALGGYCTLVAIGALLVVLMSRPGSRSALAGTGVLLYRLRWLLVSLWVLYAGFTPGETLFPAWGRWSPSVEGIREGLLRTGVLVCMIVGVQMLIATMPRRDLLGAIVWLARPLHRIGVSGERLALRMILVMETLPAVQSLFVAPPTTSGSTPSSLRSLSARAGALFEEVLAKAESAPLQTHSIDGASSPPRRQWSIPLLLAGALWLLEWMCT